MNESFKTYNLMDVGWNTNKFQFEKWYYYIFIYIVFLFLISFIIFRQVWLLFASGLFTILEICILIEYTISFKKWIKIKPEKIAIKDDIIEFYKNEKLIDEIFSKNIIKAINVNYHYYVGTKFGHQIKSKKSTFKILCQSNIYYEFNIECKIIIDELKVFLAKNKIEII